MVFIRNVLFAFLLPICGHNLVNAQGTQVDFASVPKSGTILIYAHADDDLIWMLPWWNKTEKFISGAVPASPDYRIIMNQQQAYMDNNGYNIAYESNWHTPWDDITDQEYGEYYLLGNSSYSYLATDHLEGRLYNNYTPLSRFEINKMKAKIEQYFADPSMMRVISHNNWGEYGHMHHIGLNLAVRELAVKYRKDAWMLGCDNGQFIDITVPNGIKWAYGSFNTPDLFTTVRAIYDSRYRWTWSSTYVPSGDHKFIKIVEGGNDKSDILKGDVITYPGPSQLEPGAYIFDGTDDYMTLKGNNYANFTIAFRVRPEQIRGMDICAMSEYPLSAKNDRNIYLESNGTVSTRIYDGSSRSMTSSAVISAGTWNHIAITGNGSSLKLYINGVLDKTISTGNAITDFSTPEFILGQATRTSSYFNGQISDVRLLNYVMTDSEIAQISQRTYSITANSGTGGSISPSGTIAVTSGTNKSFTITPATGYNISGVLVDNINQGAISSYTFNNVISDHTISASFSVKTYTISAVAGAGGSITPAGTSVVNHGSGITYLIVANTGFQVTDVKIDNVSIGAVSSYTFSNVTSNRSISVTFSRNTYTIYAVTGAGGIITPAGTSIVNHGSGITYQIIPNTGFRIIDVKIDNISAGVLSSYTFNNVTSNHTISATFARITYTISAVAGTGGSVTPAGTSIVNHGNIITYQVIPDTGFQIADVKIDNVSVGAVSEYIFNNVITNHTISATFTPAIFTINSNSSTGGSISPKGIVTASYGTDIVYSINPDIGYNIADVIVNNSSIGPVSVFTFSNITRDNSITANFSINKYTLTADANAGGTVFPGGNSIINYGSDQNYSFSPNYGYKITDIKIDGISKGAITSYSFKNIKENHTISAIFSPKITYTINASPESGGSITPSGSISLFEGLDQVYNIKPDNGFRILDVIVDNKSVGVLPEYTFSNISQNHNITARFTSSIDAIVYPNPFSNEFNIYIDSPEEFQYDITIVDLSGKTIYSQNKLQGNTIIPMYIQMSKGFYLINVYHKGNKVTTIRVVKA